MTITSGTTSGFELLATPTPTQLQAIELPGALVALRLT